jgi:hypothetical protein
MSLESAGRCRTYQLRIDDADLEGLPAEVHRFRQMPLPDEVARLAENLLP